MAKNRSQDTALHLSLPVPEGTKSGEPVLGGDTLPGVAITDRGAGGNLPDEATVWCDGSWNLTVDGATTKGGKVYIVPATRALVTTATGNTLFGYALGVKAAAAGVVEVRIAQV